MLLFTLNSFTDWLDIVIQSFNTFVSSLDWKYIFGIIIISYSIEKGIEYKDLSWKFRSVFRRISKPIRVLIIGILLGMLLIWTRDFEGMEKVEVKNIIETMVYSLFMSFAIYSLVMRYMLNQGDKLVNKIFKSKK